MLGIHCGACIRHSSFAAHPLDFRPQHQPLAPEQRSAYSELAVNLDFMVKLQQDQRSRSSSTSSPPPPSVSNVRPVSPKVIPKARRILPTPRPTIDTDRQPAVPSLSSASLKHEKLPSPTLTAVNFVPSPTTYVAVSPAPAGPTDPPSPPATSGPVRNVKEPRRPSLACTFCRERKIACGRPPGGSPDPTCK